MANKLGNAVIPAGMDSKSRKFDLSENHLTTTGFFQFQPVYIREMTPNSTIEISNELISRANPMSDPAFVDAKFRLNHFFVPMRTIWKGWNSFIVNTANPANGTIYTSVPVITNNTLVQYFVGSISSQLYLGPLLQPATEGVENWDIDYIVYNSQGTATITKYNFTTAGRRVYKILNSLGYKILWVTDNRTSASQDQTLKHNYSLMPLLAVVRIYLDWYYNSQYTYQTQTYKDLIKLFTEFAHVNITTTLLSEIFTMLYSIYYEDDYFVSCTDKAIAPTITSTYSISDPATDQNTVVQNRSFDVPTVDGDSAQMGSFSQYIIDLLHSVTDYFKRKQIAGNKVVDRYLTQYGIKLNNDKVDQSTYLNNDIYQLQIGDVMSNSETSGANLGDYAGKGFASGGQKQVRFQTDEFGYYIIIMSMIPKIGYYQGSDPILERKGMLQFFNGEFDGQGYCAIPSHQLLIKPHILNQGQIRQTFTKIFGWLPRYADYKTSLDKMTGDFTYMSETQYKGWHSFRDVAKLYENSTMEDVAHSINFVGANDVNQYNRIFYSDSANDKFKVYLRFHVKMYQRMKYLFDSYHFDDGGNDVSISPNGTTIH